MAKTSLRYEIGCRVLSPRRHHCDSTPVVATNSSILYLSAVQDLVDVLADGQWWLHKDGWNCEGGGLDRYYNHPVFSYHDVSQISSLSSLPGSSPD